MKIVKPQASDTAEVTIQSLTAESQPVSEVTTVKADAVRRKEEFAREADAKKVQVIRKGLQENQEESVDEYPEDLVVKTSKDKYSKEYLDSHQANLTEHLDELIRNYPRYGSPQNQAEKAIAFEATLDYCIKNGKSTAETVMRAIVLGLANGIIRYEHLSYYQKYVNSFPVLDFLFGKSKKDLEKMAKLFKGSRGLEKFKDYYWTVVMVDPVVASRIQKSASSNVWDHDTIAAIAPGGDHNVSKLIATRPNSETSVENMYTGTLQGMQKNFKSSLKKAPRDARRQLGFFLITHGIISHRAFQNVQPIKGERYLLNGQTRQSVPRMSEYYFGKPKTMDQIDKDIWSLVEPVEPALFTLLKRSDLTFEELRDYLQKKYNFQINSFDDFYDKIDEVLVKILPDSRSKKGFFLTRWLGFGR